MRIDLPVSRRRPLSMTSLIDVIFLLFLFFMLSSTFLHFTEVEVTGGAASSAAATEAPDILIRLDGETWQVNGVSADPDQGLAELKRLQDQGAEKAVLLVREGLTSQDLVSALERIRKETTLSVTVAR
ncbi:biopolymer transporter ExbD [Chelativorans sp. AA-79]|uniref:biopolymer transporter ExbD n=1 Tax=Chelativorans sp. AA-79 TaxID=3028735 RepID=UPI0023F9C375|nr:biopolymer transporter ExbD [Chelativorans sp. AA-79]WEX11461.1 biopolymer transporter ExbD [Chelativorans sp. AA-79]